MGHREKNRVSSRKQKETPPRVNTRKQNRLSKFLNKLNPFSSCCSRGDKSVHVESTEAYKTAPKSRRSAKRSPRTLPDATSYKADSEGRRSAEQNLEPSSIIDITTSNITVVTSRRSAKSTQQPTSSLDTSSTMTDGEGRRSAGSTRHTSPSPDAITVVTSRRPSLESLSQPVRHPMAVASHTTDTDGRRSTEEKRSSSPTLVATTSITTVADGQRPAEENRQPLPTPDKSTSSSGEDSSSVSGSWDSVHQPELRTKSAKSIKSAKSSKSSKSVKTIKSARFDNRVHPLCTASPAAAVPTDESTQEAELHYPKEDGSPGGSEYSVCDATWTKVVPFSEEDDGDDEEDCSKKERCYVFPPIENGLRGWKMPENIHQFAIKPEHPHNLDSCLQIMSCAINHVMLAVRYYRHLQQGTMDMFKKEQCTEAMKEMFRYAIRKGNTYHLMGYSRYQCITALQALNHLKEHFVPGLEWNLDDIRALFLEQGIDIPDDLLPEGLELEIVNPESDDTSLARYVLQLDVEKSEALLYTIDNKFMLFVPTDDGRILLIDEHPHPRINAGAIVLVAPDTRAEVQKMLDGYFKESAYSGFNLGQATKFSYSC